MDADVAAIRRSRAIAAAAAVQRTAVGAYRTYRKGELPDVQITPRDLLAPLQARAHADVPNADPGAGLAPS